MTIPNNYLRAVHRQPEPMRVWCLICGQHHPAPVCRSNLPPLDAAQPQYENHALSKFMEAAREVAASHPQEMASAAPETGSERVETVQTLNDSGNGVSFTIWGVPVPKPRQTRSDKWKQRPCVIRYREWADKAREAAKDCCLLTRTELHIRVYLPIPKSYSRKKSERLAGEPHFNGGDSDNFLKAAGDALFKQDKGLWRVSAEKRWDDGRGPRVEINVK